VYNLWLSPLAKVPGPLSHAISNIPHDIACIRGVRHLHLEKLHEQYGSIVRISPNELSFIDSCIWRDVYAHRKGDAECAKADKQENPNGYPGILDADRIDHRRYRRLLGHAFSEQSLRPQEPRLQYHVNELISGLRQDSKAGPQDFTEWLQWVTFDIMGDLAFGESFDSLPQRTTHPWQKFILDNIAALVFMGIAERMGLGRLIKLLTPASLLKAVAGFYQSTSDQMDRRLAHGKDRGDFLDHILKHGLINDNTSSSGAEKGLHIEELKSIASDIAIAGSETTSTLLTGLIYQLLMNPPALTKLTQELRSIPTAADLTIANLDRLPYLHAVIQEALRVFVPSPIPSAREIPAGGLSVGGYFLPQGTRVFAAHYIAYRSPTHFARPKEFIPKRWLPDRPEEFKDDDADGKYPRSTRSIYLLIHVRTGIFQPFAYGPRNCIGKNLAYAELRLILAKVLWHFELSKPVADEDKVAEWEGWWDRLRVFFLWHKPPLMVNVQERAVDGVST
jgi:averantin hydroxylase